VTRTVLAVDTTHEYGSIALMRDGELLEEVAMHATTGFGQVLYAALGALLKRHAVAPAEIDCFAAASGPGSFTGVRVGVACVKGLAEATGKGALAVSNLEAIARYGRAPLRAVMLDARRGDIYAAVYDDQGRIVMPELVMKLPQFLETLPKTEVDFVSQDFSIFGDGLPAAPRIVAPRELAAMVARIASVREPRDPAELDANYVRRADAELYWKEEQ
jgi:tRNA threonylcarbamoyladenosine biosynthesis protein TsaB